MGLTEEVCSRIDICVNSSDVPGHISSNILYRDVNGYHNECRYYDNVDRLNVTHSDVFDLEVRDIYGYCAGFCDNNNNHIAPKILNKKEFDKALDVYYLDFAGRINDIVKDVDIYEYRDNIDNEEDMINNIYNDLKNGDIYNIKHFLKTNVVDDNDMDFDFRSSVSGLINELNNCSVKIANNNSSYDKLKDMVSKIDDYDKSEALCDMSL